MSLINFGRSKLGVFQRSKLGVFTAGGYAKPLIILIIQSESSSQQSTINTYSDEAEWIDWDSNGMLRFSNNGSNDDYSYSYPSWIDTNSNVYVVINGYEYRIWKNPLYRWNVLARDRYAWWVARFQSCLRRFDAVRLDHFIGFHRAWPCRLAPGSRAAGPGSPDRGPTCSGR